MDDKLDVTRLQFYSVTYSRKDKYKGRYFVKKRSSRYKGRQQGCLTAQRRIMDKKNYSRSNDVKKKQDDRQSGHIGRNKKKQH